MFSETAPKGMSMMKVGVYVDAFNVYFGGRYLCGRGKHGWRWLDIRSLATDLVSLRTSWAGATIEKIVYCTALIDGAASPGGRTRQDAYLRALQDSGSVDHVELGYYVSRVKTAPLATKGSKGKPVITTSGWPVMVKDRNGADTPNATFMVSYAHREEKGSDVNVASHLLVDAYQGTVDAALVLSNDSDLRYPIQEVRKQIPVGTINPTPSQLAGALRGTPTDGVGRHWWYQLTCDDFKTHQLPNTVGNTHRPTSW